MEQQDKIWIPQNTNIFDGSQNVLSATRPYNVNFICVYDMMFYPFDSQVCYADIIMKGNVDVYVKLVPDELNFFGDTELSQYFIRGYHHCIREIRKGKNGIRVEVLLGRRLVGNALTVFLPTLLLNIIGHSTNYFKPFFFEAVISVNLTVLLVLATMFISVSDSLPDTSYVKMIDIWLLFNLIIPFVEVLLHTYIDSLREEDGEGGEEREINHHGKPRKVEPLNNDQVIQVASASDKKLVSRDEKVQVNALRNFYSQAYDDPHSKKNLIGLVVSKIFWTNRRQKKLDMADRAAHRIIPGIALTFIGVFWIVGLLLYTYPKRLGLINPYCDEF